MFGLIAPRLGIQTSMFQTSYIIALLLSEGMQSPFVAIMYIHEYVCCIVGRNECVNIFLAGGIQKRNPKQHSMTWVEKLSDVLYI